VDSHQRRERDGRLSLRSLSRAFSPKGTQQAV